MTNRLMNKLTRSYNKRFTKLCKTVLKDNKAGLIFFIEHLKYLRDAAIIKAAPGEDLNSIVGTLVVAIDEFEAYQNSSEAKQKDFHWNNFCEFIKLNLEEWLVLNDPI